MQSPTYDFMVVIQNASRCYPQARTLAAQLAARVDGPQLVGTDLYFRGETDVALLGLRLDLRHTSRALLGELTDMAMRAGQAVLEPGRLPGAELSRFRQIYLPKYGVHIADLPGIEDAVRVLGETLGVNDTPRPNEDPARERLEVRFRRGDDWQLGRVRSLTVEAIYVSTGGPPRRGDLVDLELQHDHIAFSTRATVVHVTPSEAAAALGAAGFGARFLATEAVQRARLQRFLSGLRGAVPAGLVPPPRRREVRYPVRWPVYLGAGQTGDAGSRTAALDISRHGMFIASAGQLPFPDAQVELTLPLDDNGAPVRAHARVARTVNTQIAQARGVATGVGLEIGALPAREEHRFQRFLQRVGRRATCTVVVAASRTRAALIVSELQAAGYAAAGASDAPTLINKAAAAARAPDLVMLDASLTRGDARAEGAVRRALAVRSVPLLQVDDSSPETARSLADVALLS